MTAPDAGSFRVGRLGLLAVIGFAAATAGCGAMPGSPAAAGDRALIDRVMQQVEKNYVVPVQSDKLVDNALKGMLTRLDPHSDYMDEREYQDLLATTSGAFGGVGIEISVENGVPQVITAIEGTPAAAAGVEPGDRIVKANGEPIIGLDITDVVSRLRGAPGTPVVLTIARANRPSFDVPITRAIVRVDSVKAMLKPGHIGFVRISTFNENTPEALSAALARLRAQAGGRLAGLVLDLRNDAGGLLDTCVEVAANFLDSGTIVSTRGRRPDENRVFEAQPNGDLLRGVPIVVLINGATASAAEIVAGALQDNRRATILGTRSFGKGSVQSVIPIEGSGALRLTTALYYTPSGNSIQGRGIVPDRVVTVPKEAQVANAMITYESDLSGALRAAGTYAPKGAAPVPPPRRLADEDRPINPKVIGTAQDAQLNAALDLLGAPRPGR